MKVPDDNEQYVSHRASDIVNSMLLEDITVSINNKPVTEQDPKGLNIDKSIESMKGPMLDILQQSFQNAHQPSQQVSVDEAMVRFKGRSSLKQYMSKVPPN